MIPNFISALFSSTDRKILLGSACWGLVGLLVSGGYISQAHATDVEKLFETIAGNLITIIAAVYFFEHQFLVKKTEVAKQAEAAATPPQPTPAS